jgi:hypothetical protein
MDQTLVKPVLKMKVVYLLSLLLASQLHVAAGIKSDVVVPGDKPQINTHLHFTSNTGLALPAEIAKAVVGKLVKIYRTDGFCYEGKITEIEESDDALKIYGDIYNVPGVRFGFAMARGGKFAGAVIDKDKDITYVLEFSEAHKGYVLIRAYKFEKGVS